MSKRTTRNLSPQTKQKLSDALKRYWSTIPVSNPETTQDNKNKNKTETEIPTL